MPGSAASTPSRSTSGWSTRRCSYAGNTGHHRRAGEPHGAHRLREVRVHRRHGGQRRRQPAGRRPVLLRAAITTCGMRMSTPTRTTTQTAGTRAATRTRSSPPRSISRPTRTWRPRASIRSTHFDSSAGRKGACPRSTFDPARISRANPDVRRRRRSAVAFPAVRRRKAACRSRRTSSIAANGFDYVYYLQNNPTSRPRASIRSALPDHRLEGRPQSERAVRHQRLSGDLHRRAAATSIRSTTTTRAAGTKGAIPRSASTRRRISPPIRTWTPRTSIRWCTSSSSASTKAAPPSPTACGADAPRSAADETHFALILRRLSSPLAKTIVSKDGRKLSAPGHGSRRPRSLRFGGSSP